MKVERIMTPQPVSCSRATNLAEAGALMLEADCGILPVVEDGRLAGVITDRDMCIALATRNRLASELTVGIVMRHQLFTCAPEDDIRAALAVMKQHRVRRLPVAGPGQVLLGIISMNDIVCALGSQDGVANDEVVETLQAICSHRLPVAQVVSV
jgi:CBS domain-containing protein